MRLFCLIAMLARYFTVLGLLLLAGLIIRHVFSRRQQRAVHELVVLSAKVIVAAAVLAMLWKFFVQG